MKSLPLCDDCLLAQTAGLATRRTKAVVSGTLAVGIGMHGRECYERHGPGVRQLQKEMDQRLAASFGGLDMEQVGADYIEQDEFVYVPMIVDAETCRRMVAETGSAKIHRSMMPWIRQAGTIGYRRLLEVSPTITTFYQSPEMIALTSRLAGKQVYLKSENDDHACALYSYTKPGDHMQYHYDACGCDEDSSYTLIFTLLNDSTQNFLAKLYVDDPKRETRELAIGTELGSAVIFCGSKIWHGVSSLGPNQHRVVLSLAYASEPHMNARSRFRENLKDSILYFGPTALLQRNYAKTGAEEARPESAQLKVLITGASYGIGAELARQYAAKGAQVALFARRADKLEEVAQQCEALGASATLCLPGDTTKPEDVAAASAKILETWGRVDRAYLNAGGYGARDSEELASTRDIAWTTTGFSADATERVMRLNYLGAVYWLEHMLAHMRCEGQGTIAVTGAMAGDRGHPKHGPYAATKAALRALFDSLRADAARYGITMVLIEPGCIESGLTEAHCCDEMPFLQRTDKAVSAFITAVERGDRVVRFPWRGSVASRFVALLPRAIFDRWATGKLPKVHR